MISAPLREPVLWSKTRPNRGRQLLQEVFPETGRALSIGITGPPGAGKSTLVSRIAARLRAQSKRVGIIGVDPSSPFSQGAILGDRIRMHEHHGDSGVFIRSMATRGQLGGLAAATLELTLLIDAAGFDIVLIETVGVGQDEIEISRLADVTVLVLVPQMGDDVRPSKPELWKLRMCLQSTNPIYRGQSGWSRRFARCRAFLQRRQIFSTPRYAGQRGRSAGN